MFAKKIFSRKLFGKYYALLLLILSVFVLFGFILDSAFMHFSNPPPPNERFPAFFAQMLQEFGGAQEASFKHLEKMDLGAIRYKLYWLSESGELLYPKNTSLPVSWAEIEKPTSLEQVIVLKKPRRPGPGRLLEQPPKGPPAHLGITLLSQNPQTFLLVEHNPPRPKMQDRIFTLMGVLLLSLMLGSACVLLILFRIFATKATEADQVIAQLQAGNLKARFQIRKWDEFGQAMHRFNLMAEQIEALVTQLRESESTRLRFLQELAHDLRTPISSLKNLLETLDLQRAKLTEDEFQEIVGLALREVDYFERLVEDLLFLAQFIEPKYQEINQRVNFLELLEDEILLLKTQYPDREIILQTNLSRLDSYEKHSEISGNRLLLQRLIRNATDNACLYASHQVKLELKIETQNGSIPGILVFSVEDDGPGFPVEVLHEFGKRRLTRQHNIKANGKVSLGLGSYIMSTVAHLHAGSISAQNKLAENGQIKGARLEFRFKSS